MRLASASRLALLAAALALASRLPARAQTAGEIAGTYTIHTSEGYGGVVRIGADLLVVRRVYFTDKTVHTQTGVGKLEGATLTVTFAGSGEPTNLEGSWSVQGTGDEGRTKGTLTLARSETGWAGKLARTSLQSGTPLPELEVTGTLAGQVLTAQRGGAAATYALGRDGLTLVAKLGSGTETCSRSQLPADGGPTATYTFEGGKISGKLSSGGEDTGTAPVKKTEVPPAFASLAVEPDPVPAYLRAAHETVVHTDAQGNGEARKLELHERIQVKSREGDFWVVGPLPGPKGYFMGYVKADDLEKVDHFTAVAAPIFVRGDRPRPNNVVQRNLATCYFDSALMAIAGQRPQLIESMIKDLGDGTVAVRFHARDEHHQLAPQWVRIQKTVPVDAKGHGQYTLPDGTGQLWPALATKGFAAWSGKGKGFYHAIEWGDAKDAFELVAGKDAHEVQVQATLLGHATRALKGGASDQAALSAWRQSDAGKAAVTELTNHPSRRNDAAWDKALVAKIPGLSAAGRAKLAASVEAEDDGPPGSGRYGSTSSELFARLEKGVAQKWPACACAAAFADGADAEKVPGIVSSHFYMVEGTSEDEKKVRWVKLVNPTHGTTRVYEREGDRLVGKESTDEKARGEFSLELSDFRRFYAVYCWVELGP